MNKWRLIAVAAGATGVIIYGVNKLNIETSEDKKIKKALSAVKVDFPKVQALRMMSRKVNEDHLFKGLKLNHRERRFIKFASVEHVGQLYMTPQDFIESVTDSEPRPRLKRRVLSEQDIEKMTSETPPISKGSPNMFRTVYDKGIISYTEYLFLLSILTKPQTGFRIAFNMFDTDGNQRVDKEEFLVLMKLLALAYFKDFKVWVSRYQNDDASEELRRTERFVSVAVLGPSPSVAVGYTASSYGKLIASSCFSSQTRHTVNLWRWHFPAFHHYLSNLEKIFSTARRDRFNRAMEGVAKSSSPRQHSDSDEESLEESTVKAPVVNTTLLVHFFGKKGKQELQYDDFKRFMENLQTEVLEIEFTEFSKGYPTISEMDLAKILLRYTYLQSDQYEMYLERLLDRLHEEKGITFLEFKSFCQFLNTLDDFCIAMKMYTLADQPISQDEFHRAVKSCTGQELSPHVVDTVFKIFDEDGDGQLSYKEFIAIMRNRLHRGFKHNSRREGWDAFKHCIKAEMKVV